MQTRKRKLIITSIVAILLDMFAPSLVTVVLAAPPPQFTQAFVRINRHKTLTDTGGTVCATPSLADAAVFVDVLFPTQGTGTDFVVDTTAAHWTVTTTNLPSGATAWPGIGTATTVTGKTVRFPSTSLTSGVQYCFNFYQGTGAGDRTLKTGSSGYVGVIGSVTTYASGGVTINEQTNWATSVIADDQVVVSAVVPPSFNFTLSGNTDAFTANLDPLSVVSTTGVTFTIITNAKTGWIAWVKDSQQGLFSTTANYTIPTTGTIDATPSTLVANGSTEGYVLDTAIITDAAGGCTVARDAEYLGTGSNQGGTLSANFQPVGSCTGSPPATSNGDTFKIIERATIAGGTPAGSDYTDIITVVGAGNF